MRFLRSSPINQLFRIAKIMTIKYGSLFSGIGGFDLGFDRAGMTCAWQVEWDEYRRGILAEHWPTVTRYEDVRTVGRHNLEPVDLICGGFPCQDISVANQRGPSSNKGLDGERSGLWFEFFRVVCEIRPRWVVIENVRRLLSVNDGRDIATILWQLASVGYDAEWEVVPSLAVGAPQIRERLFIVAYTSEVGRLRTEQVLTGIDEAQLAQPWQDQADHIHLEDFGLALRGLPESVRVPDGFFGNVDKSLEAFGDAVSPVVAEYIGRCILRAAA